MLDPSIDKLLTVVNSKYKLVHVVSQRSKEIHNTGHLQMSNEEYKNKKDLGRAMEEVEKNLIKVDQTID